MYKCFENPEEWKNRFEEFIYEICKNGDCYIKLANEIKWKAFKDKERFDYHYDKHGKEFGDPSIFKQKDYLTAAKNFAKDPSKDFKETQIGNIIIKQDPKTNTIFLGNAKNKEIRTFYKGKGSAEQDWKEALETAKYKTGK